MIIRGIGGLFATGGLAFGVDRGTAALSAGGGIPLGFIALALVFGFGIYAAWQSRTA